MNGIEFAARVTGVAMMTPAILFARMIERVGMAVAERLLFDDDMIEWLGDDDLD